MKKLIYLVLLTLASCLTEKEDVIEGCDCSKYLETSVSNNQTTSLALSEDFYSEEEEIVLTELNLNGHSFEAPSACVTITGNLNGGGSFIVNTYYVKGNIQNNPIIEGEEIPVSCAEYSPSLSVRSFEMEDKCKSICLNK